MLLSRGYTPSVTKMPRPTQATIARRQNIEKARNSQRAPVPIERPIEDKTATKISGKMLAYAILVEGGNYAQTASIFTQCRIPVVHESAFHEAQKKIRPFLEEMGKASISYWQQQVEPGSVMCIDGGWDHKRNGRHCVVSVIDNSNWKIIEFELLKRGNELGGSVNYTGSSSNMESTGIRRILDRIAQNDDLKAKFVAFCHDCDGRVRALFEDCGWDLDELLDINHAMLAFQRSFKNANVQNEKCLEGLYFKLKLWTYHVISMQTDTETKIKAFLNAADHYTGKHDNCDHEPDLIDFVNPLIDDPHTYDVLLQFLKDNIYIIEQCNPIANTQINESFNNTRARTAMKTFAWRDSYRSRTWVAILDTNEFHRDWRSELRSKLKLPPLPPALQEEFNRKMKAKIERSKYRHTDEYKRAERIRRQVEKRQFAEFETHVPEYNAKHIPGWHLNDETYALIESLDDDKFKEFMQLERTKKPDLLQLIRSFINYDGFEDHKKYLKKLIIVAQSCCKATKEEFYQIYDKVYIQKLRDASSDEIAASIRREQELPSFATELARNMIEIEELEEAPVSPIQFVLKNVNTGETSANRYMFPYCKNTSEAIRQIEGFIISQEEIQYYPIHQIFRIENTELYFVPKHYISKSCNPNCELKLYQKDGIPLTYLKKREKRKNLETNRWVNVKVKAGDFVYLPL